MGDKQEMENDERTSTNSRRSTDKELAQLAASLRQDILNQTPFTLASDPEFGLYLVAKRNIKAGEVLFEDKAAIAGPCANIGDVEYETPLCLGCCVLMEEEKVKENRCDSCGWPVCSMECKGIENHTKNECQLFTEYGTTFPPDTGIASCYAVIHMMRGILLKDNNPEMWALIMTLQWKTQIEYKGIPLNIPSLKECYGLPPDFGSDEEWTRMYGIVSVNNHTTTLPISHGSTSIRCGEALFPLYSLVANSCCPNCVWALKYDDQVAHSFTLQMYPTVNIRKGEMITATYISSLTKHGNHNRRRKLRERMKFRCMCLRCEDPTEMGSYFDALKCFRCSDGYMLPIMAEDDCEDDSYWICELCHHSVPLLFGRALLELIFEQLLDTGRKSGMEGGGHIVKHVESFIQQYSDVYLHPNHYVLAEAAYVILQVQMSKIDGRARLWISPQITDNMDEGTEILSVAELDRYLELCEYLLAIGTKLAPGLSVERGMAFYYIARGLFYKLDLLLGLTGNSTVPPTTTDQLLASHNNADLNGKEELKKLDAVQKQALQFWLENPRRYIFNKGDMVKVERLKKEVEITTKFKASNQW